MAWRVIGFTSWIFPSSVEDLLLCRFRGFGSRNDTRILWRCDCFAILSGWIERDGRGPVINVYLSIYIGIVFFCLSFCFSLGSSITIFSRNFFIWIHWRGASLSSMFFRSFSLHYFGFLFIGLVVLHMHCNFFYLHQ